MKYLKSIISAILLTSLCVNAQTINRLKIQNVPAASTNTLNDIRILGTTIDPSGVTHSPVEYITFADLSTIMIGDLTDTALDNRAATNSITLGANPLIGFVSGGGVPFTETINIGSETTEIARIDFRTSESSAGTLSFNSGDNRFTMEGGLDVGDTIQGVADPVNGTDAANRQWVLANSGGGGGGASLEDRYALGISPKDWQINIPADGPLGDAVGAYWTIQNHVPGIGTSQTNELKVTGQAYMSIPQVATNLHSFEVEWFTPTDTNHQLEIRVYNWDEQSLVASNTITATATGVWETTIWSNITANVVSITNQPMYLFEVDLTTTNYTALPIINRKFNQ